MKQEELDKLTFEQRRKCIAILRGWHECKYEDGRYIGKLADSHVFEEVPDYFNDLNEMREVETFFAPVDEVLLRRTYVFHLMELVGVSPNMDRWSFIQDFLLLNATATQKANAYLLTIG